MKIGVYDCGHEGNLAQRESEAVGVNAVDSVLPGDSQNEHACQ